MSLVLKDRVRETTTVTGTNDAALLGAVVGFQSFSVVGNGNTCYYTIADQSGGNWEVGIGTYTASGSTLSRDTVLASSNGGGKTVFTSGTKDVFLTYPSEKAAYLDANGNLNIYSDGELRLNDTSGGEYVALKSPSSLSASYTLTMPVDDGTNGQALITDGSGNLSWSTAASGDVYGPASATDNAVARFDLTTGKIIQNSGVIIDDSNNVTGVAALTASGAITLSGATANGVAYLNGSKVLTTGSALTFDGTTFATTGRTSSANGAWVASGAVMGWGAAGTFSNYIVGDTTSNYQLFQVNSSEQMRLTSTGLGIGTSSPAYKLDVNGAAAIRGNAFSTGAFIPAANVSAPTADASIYRAADNTLAFATASTERLRLDSAGNLGLGVTPSAWYSGWKAFEIGFGGNALWSVSGQDLRLSTNLYNNGSNNVYKANGVAASYIQQSGAHIWQTAPSGTAGNAISFTQAMTLDASGNLGIGTSSPGSKLDINGNTRVLAGNTTYWMNDASDASAYIQNDAGTGSARMKFGVGGTEAMRIDSSGNLLVGRTDNADGSTGKAIYAVGSYTQTSSSAANVYITPNGLFLRSTSSKKYKTEIEDAVHGLNEVIKLRSVTYKGISPVDKNSNTIFGGLIAEEVHDAGLTEFVQYAEDGTPDALHYGNMVALCIKAIQEQQELINQLTARVAQLEGN